MVRLFLIALLIDANQISRQCRANFRGRLQRLFLGASKGKEILQWPGFTDAKAQVEMSLYLCLGILNSVSQPVAATISCAFNASASMALPVAS